MKVKDLLERIEYSVICGHDGEEASGICFDNRKVKPGDVFVCIRGAYFDTHSIIPEISKTKPAAIIADKAWAESADAEMLSGLKTSGTNIIAVEDTRIAKACVSAAFYGYPSEKMTVIGVTGSKGKTTTSHMIWSILGAAGIKAGLISTTGGHIGDKDVHFGTSTPDSDKMQEFLAEMVNEGCKYAVVEASSQGLKLHRTGYIDFDYGIFLNIEKGDHISPNEHKDFDEYLDCKRRLLKASMTSIVNGDDEHIDEMIQGVEGRIVKYGFDDRKNDHVISDVSEIKDNGDPCISFMFDGSEYVVGMPGVFNAGNAASAVIAAKECGIPDEPIKDALRNIKVPGRLDMVYRSEDLSVCIDYAHNGLSTRNLLKALRSYEPKRIVCVFGCGGDRDVDRRPEMGEASGSLADLSIITTEHNRFEEFGDILQGILNGIKLTEGKYEIIEDRKEAIRHAIVDSEPGDLVTILGIGNDGFQHDHGKDIPHDDISYSLQMVDEWLQSKR